MIVRHYSNEVLLLNLIIRLTIYTLNINYKLCYAKTGNYDHT